MALDYLHRETCSKGWADSDALQRQKQLPTLDELCSDLSIVPSAFDKFRRALKEVEEAIRFAEEKLEDELQDLKDEGVPENQLRNLKFLALEMEKNVFRGRI